MDESLWIKFLDETIEDLQVVLLTTGVNGLLGAFEYWLRCNGYLNDAK